MFFLFFSLKTKETFIRKISFTGEQSLKKGKKSFTRGIHFSLIHSVKYSFDCNQIEKNWKLKNFEKETGKIPGKITFQLQLCFAMILETL